VLVAGDLLRAAALASIPIAAVLGLLSVAQLIVVSLLVGLAVSSSTSATGAFSRR
jgi:hypothetical protein